MSDDTKIQIAVSNRAVTHILIALREYEERLRNDEDDPGPSMDDAMFVRWLQGELKAAVDAAS
ncbi:MAG: hypothetical protein QNI99_09155 [Woeseiaceae bacterium]|nr:hypothetical protein [Woeseiaceae bacterium]